MSGRTFDDVVQIEKPEPDTHYRLRACECGSSDVAYIKTIKLGRGTEWVAGCITCGRTTRACTAQHSAQIEWNGKEAPKWARE